MACKRYLVKCIFCSGSDYIAQPKYTEQSVHSFAWVKLIDDLYIGMMRGGEVPSHIEQPITDIISADPRCERIGGLEVLATLPNKTNFLCEFRIFLAICRDILGDSVALHLGLYMICPGFHSAVDDIFRILARAIN